MTATTLHNFSGQLLIVGPLYNNLEKLSQVEDLANQYDHVIINSGLLFPSMNQVEERIARIQETLEDSKITYLIGRQDLTLWSQLEAQSETAKWIINRPNVAIVKWEAGYQVIVVDGGLTNKVSTLDDLTDNLETSFVIDWHQQYNGKMGFVVSNKPLTTVKPKPYRFSLQIGNLPNCSTYGIVLDQYGLNRTISL